MKKKGFTLIELLVVISIIALLLSILMPALNKVKVQARRIICSTRIKSIHLAATLYATDDDRDRLPQGGYHYNGTDYDDAIGMEIQNYFSLTSYITPINVETDPDRVRALSGAELAEMAIKCTTDGAAKIFVCPEIERDPREYTDVLYRKKRRMDSVVFSTMDYARLGYCYLAGFETEKWDFDQQGAISAGLADSWVSPSKMSDSGRSILVTDKTRYVPAGAGWVDEDFISIPHGRNGYEEIAPTGSGFDHTNISGGSNICTLDGAIEFKKISNTDMRQVFNDSFSGGINHEDYTFF